jgi:uncharacterized protein (TIGR02466 family)
MKHDKLFSTHIFLIDNVIPEKDILDIRKHIISTYNSDTKNWQSIADLHKMIIYDTLTDKILEYSKNVFDKLELKYDSFKITDMWSNVLKPGETHRPHTHSNNMLSGVYYVDAVETSGIIFTDPRPQAGVIQPDVNKQILDNASVVKYDSATNRMILFPSWLQHYVPVNETNKNRISVAFNIMFKGLVGSSTEYQSAEF